MSKLYYVPEPEDLHHGYEYEHGGMKDEDFQGWRKSVFTIECVPELMKFARIRTRKLSREDIEKEGWDLDQFVKGEGLFMKGSIIEENEWRLVWCEKSREITISDMNNNSNNSYSGPCPSINELRKISKLIGI